MKQNSFHELPPEDRDLQIDPEPTTRARSWQERRYLIIGTAAVLLVFLVIVLILLRFKKADTAEESVTPIVSVRVAKAEKQTIAAPVSAVGTISPREQATVAAKVSAQIKTMALLKDKLVRAGQVIAVLE